MTSLFKRGRACWRLVTRDLRGKYAEALNRITSGILRRPKRTVRIAADNCTITPSDFDARPETERKLADGGTLAGLRVLVADNDGINRSIVARMLTQWGIDAVFATDGDQALSILTGKGVDVALLDVNMPVMTGIETAQFYNFSVLGGQRTPLIAVTADPTPVMTQRCLQAGMEACLVKPVRTPDLFKALANAASVLKSAEPVSRPALPVLPPALDDATLAALHELGGAAFAAKLIAQFERDGALILDDIELACLMPRPTRISDATRQ